MLIVKKDMTLEVGQGLTREPYGENGSTWIYSRAEPIGTGFGYVAGVDPPYLQTH